MELVLGPAPPLPPPFSLLLLLGLLFIGIWSMLPGDRRQKLSAKIRETLRKQKVPGNHKATRVLPSHWEGPLQMESTGADLACFSGLPVGLAQNYNRWSMDRRLQHIFQHLETARSSLRNLSLSSQVTSAPFSNSSTTESRDLKTLTFCECSSPGFSGHQRTSLHSDLSATQPIFYSFRDRLQNQSHSLPNLSKNSKQAQVHSLLPFLLPQGNEDTTEKNIFLDKCTSNCNYEQRFCETKTSEEENDCWPPKEIRNFLELHLRRKFAQHLAHPSIFRTIRPSISPYPLAYNVTREMKTIKKMEGNGVLKVSNPSFSNLCEKPWLPCWAPIKLSHSAWGILEGHMAWKVFTLKAQRLPKAVKHSWEILNYEQNEDQKPESSQMKAAVSFPQNIVKGTNGKVLLPMDLESEQIIATTPKLSKAESWSRASLDASSSGEDVLSGEVIFLQEDVKERLELCIQKKADCLLKAMGQAKEAQKEDEKLSTRSVADSGSNVQVMDSKELTEESHGQVTDSSGLNSESQIQKPQIQDLNEVELPPVPQKQEVDSLELKGSSSRVQDIDSVATTPVPEKYDADSMELTPGQDVDSMSPTPGPQIKNVDSGRLSPESQVKLTESKELTQGSQVKARDIKGLMPESQVKLTDLKELTLGSQVTSIDSKGLIPESQVILTDSKELTQGSQVKPTDSKGLTQGSESKLKDFKGLTLKPQVEVTNSVKKVPWPCIQVVDSVGLTSESKIPVIDPKQWTLELQSTSGDSFYLIQAPTPLYILGSGSTAAKLKPGLHGSKTQEILRSMLGDLNENVVLQTGMSSKFSKTAQPSTLPKPPSVQSIHHPLRPRKQSSRCLSQAPLLPSLRSENSFFQEGQRSPRALKWPISGWLVKTLEKRNLKDRLARRKSSISMLRKNLCVKKQQAYRIQEAQVQRPPQVPFPYAPSWHFIPPRQTMVSQSRQRNITGSPFRTSLPVNDIQSDRLCQLCSKNLLSNEQEENSKPRTSRDYPNLTTKGAPNSSEPTEGRKKREQVPFELHELRHSRRSRRPPSTEANPRPAEQNEKPATRSQLRSKEPRHKPLSVPSSREQSELLQELQLRITQRLLKNQLSSHFTPAQNREMVLQYPICLQCGRCSGPGCPHKFHDSVGPWLLIYPQLRLFRNSEGRGEFRVQLGFRLRTRTQAPKQQKEVEPLVPTRHGPEPSEERKKGGVCTCQAAKENPTLSPCPQTDFGPGPFRPPEPPQTPGPIQVHIKRNLPGRRVEVLRAGSEDPEQCEFTTAHSFLAPDAGGGWAGGGEQMRTPEEAGNAAHKLERALRQGMPQDGEARPGRGAADARKAAPASRRCEEPKGVTRWVCHRIKRALGMAYSRAPAFHQVRPWAERAPGRPGAACRPEGKLWPESLSPGGLATDPGAEGRNADTDGEAGTMPGSISGSQSSSLLNLSSKSSSTCPVPTKSSP